jgi:hypothetical protein
MLVNSYCEISDEEKSRVLVRIFYSCVFVCLRKVRNGAATFRICRKTSVEGARKQVSRKKGYIYIYIYVCLYGEWKGIKK